MVEHPVGHRRTQFHEVFHARYLVGLVCGIHAETQFVVNLSSRVLVKSSGFYVDIDHDYSNGWIVYEVSIHR